MENKKLRKIELDTLYKGLEMVARIVANLQDVVLDMKVDLENE